MTRSVTAAALATVAFCGFAQVASAFSFDDIRIWAGNGPNRAALVIDWAGASGDDQALAWGYRFNGTATGEDMVQAILAADPHFYARLGDTGSLGVPLYGWGYDLNRNNTFGIDDGTTFSHQIAVTDIPDDDGVAAMATDPGDLYAEGWITGYWNHATASGNPLNQASWNSAITGFSQLNVTDGLWEGFAWDPTFSSFYDSPVYPANLVAAGTPEPTGLALLVAGGALLVGARRWRRLVDLLS
jgi:hypothetical protein